MMRSIFTNRIAAVCAALGSLALAGQARAQALDLKNTTPRMANVETMDASGAFGPKLPAALTFDGGTATLTIAAADAMPGAPTFGPIGLMGGAIMVAFANGRFDTVSDRTISIDVATGDARVAQMTMGMIDLQIMALGLNQPIAFNTASVSATNLGPLFSADTVRDPNAPGITSGAPLRIQGMGRACAMMGSGFLDPMIGVPPCTPETFANTVQLDPKPFDAATGTVTTVGFNGITLPPFMVLGAITINVQPIQNATPLTLRLTEATN